jgi:hypothetical protein
MNQALETLALKIRLADPEHFRLRLEFGLACALRISHLLEEAEVIECLDAFRLYVAGLIDASSFKTFQDNANRLANQHPGSKSIDGGHSAVSASYALANAMNGKALVAASYAAYSVVYASGGYSGVAQREAFDPEFRWQVSELERLWREFSANKISV